MSRHVYIHRLYDNDNDDDNIILNSNYVTSTNCLERINRSLKDAAAGGHLPLSRVCRVLVSWKHNYLKEYEERVKNDNMHRRKSTTIARETALNEILDNYYKMTYPTQIEELVSTCLKIGSINKMISKTNNFISAQTENPTENE